MTGRLTTNSAAELYRHMLAIWPDAADRHDTPTVAVWVEHLAGHDYDTAAAAIRRLATEARRFPSLADFSRVCREVRQARRLEARPAALDSPADPTIGRTAIAAIRDRLARTDRHVIVAADLDRASIRHWRRRLADAHRTDSEQGSGRRHYDAAWAAIQAELAQRTPRPAGPTSSCSAHPRSFSPS